MANEYLKHFLDQAGLGLVWEKIKGLVSAEEIRAKAEELRIEGLITAEEARAIAAEAKKVDKEIVTAAGKALIFNEADGGGAKFEAADGTASFVGVNSDTNGGIGAQLYDIDVAANKGAKVDVTKNGVFYTKGDNSALPAAQRDIAANEIAVKGDIAEYTMVKDAEPGQYAAIYHLTKNGVNVGEPINIAKDQMLKSVTVKTCTEKDVPISGLNVGDKYIDFEFIVEGGATSHSYIAVKDMVKPYTADEVTLTLDANNQFSVKAIPQEKVTGLVDALNAKASTAALEAEAATRATEDAKKSDLPGELPPELKVPGVDYPWFMVNMDPKSIDADGNLHLDHSGYNFNTKQYYTWKDKVIPMAATTTTGGLMKAADKDKLDGLIPMTDAEIEAICN